MKDFIELRDRSRVLRRVERISTCEEARRGRSWRTKELADRDLDLNLWLFFDIQYENLIQMCCTVVHALDSESNTSQP